MDRRILTTQALMHSTGIQINEPPDDLDLNPEMLGLKSGCRSAGCRTLFDCLCTCKKCKKECPDRAVKHLRERFPQFNQDAARSGRVSSSAPNEANKPREE